MSTSNENGDHDFLSEAYRTLQSAKDNDHIMHIAGALEEHAPEELRHKIKAIVQNQNLLSGNVSALRVQLLACIEKNAPDSLERVPSKTEKIINDTRALLESDTIKNPIDRKALEDAVNYLEEPIGDPISIASRIGEVVGGYSQTETPEPREIYELNKHLLIRQCDHFVRVAETKMAEEPLDIEQAKALVKKAFYKAKHAARYLDNESFMVRVFDMQEKLSNL